MHKIKIISVGKTKEKWLEEAIDEYIKRLKHLLSFEFLWAKNDEQLIQFTQKESNLICLDAKGTEMNSLTFSNFFHEKLEENGSRLTLVIGGADGLPSVLKKQTLISLSQLTMTHQIIRLVLIEQIYRAFEIAKGSPYHK
jgi:23S rRNA (pseudouridine1915-N3)-methyltransferase